MLVYEELTEQVIGAAIEVHRHLGPGLLESVYEECLCHELSLRGLEFMRQVDLPITYKGVALNAGLRMDLVVDRKLVVELKSVDKLAPVHQAQLLTYMRLSKCRIGLLINFNVGLLKDGLMRRAL